MHAASRVDVHSVIRCHVAATTTQHRKRPRESCSKNSRGLRCVGGMPRRTRHRLPTGRCGDEARRDNNRCGNPYQVQCNACLCLPRSLRFTQTQTLSPNAHTSFRYTLTTFTSSTMRADLEPSPSFTEPMTHASWPSSSLKSLMNACTAQPLGAVNNTHMAQHTQPEPQPHTYLCAVRWEDDHEAAGGFSRPPLQQLEHAAKVSVDDIHHGNDGQRVQLQHNVPVL